MLVRTFGYEQFVDQLAVQQVGCIAGHGGPENLVQATEPFGGHIVGFPVFEEQGKPERVECVIQIWRDLKA